MDRKALSDHDVALVTLCESYSYGKRGPERRALMAKIVNMSLQRAVDNPKLANMLGAVFEQVFGLKELKKQLTDDEYDWVIGQLLDESMITGIDRFDIVPQAITEFFKQNNQDGFKNLGVS